MKSQYVAIHLLLFLTKTLYAKEQQEVEYFVSPSPNQSYKSGDVIQFSAEDVPDEGNTANANLYCDGSFVKTIQSWSTIELDDFGEMFDFSWVADGQTCGSCYIEMIADNDKEEVTRSYEFNLECDGTSSSENNETDPSSNAQQQSTPNLPYYDEEEVETGEEEESSIHQESNITNNKEELNKETQEEPEEMDEPTERKKLSLHNDHTKVAHISSHNDIDTVSDEPNTMTHRPPTNNNHHNVQEAKITNQQKESQNKGLLNNAVEKVKQLTSHKGDSSNEKSKSKSPVKSSGETEAVEVPDNQLEALSKSDFNPNADDKTLMDADKSAIEQEKLWIKQSNGKNPSTPKKLILGNLLGNEKSKHATTKSKTSSSTTTTTTTTHHSIPNNHDQQKNPSMMNPPPTTSIGNNNPIHQQQPPSQQKRPLSHEGQKIVDESEKSMKEKQDELQKEISEAKEDAKNHPGESTKKILEAQAEAQHDIQQLKLQEQERLAKQQEKEMSNPSSSTSTPSQYHSKHIKEAAKKNHSSHQKREAFRKVYHNRAKFAKSILQ